MAGALDEPGRSGNSTGDRGRETAEVAQPCQRSTQDAEREIAEADSAARSERGRVEASEDLSGRSGPLCRRATLGSGGCAGEIGKSAREPIDRCLAALEQALGNPRTGVAGGSGSLGKD